MAFSRFRWKRNIYKNAFARGLQIRDTMRQVKPGRHCKCPWGCFEMVNRRERQWIPEIVDFYRFMLNCRKKGNYELENIGNMDETPVWFEMPSAKTVNT